MFVSLFVFCFLSILSDFLPRESHHLRTDSFIYSFPVCIPFISFSCLIMLSRTSNMILKSTGEKGYICVEPELSWNALSFLVLNMMLTLCFVDTIFFIKLRRFPCIPGLRRVFTWIRYGFCQMAFLYLLIWSCDFFFPF